MSLTLNFRVVGLYLSVPEMNLPGVGPDSTVEKIMNNVPKTLGFSYVPITLQPSKKQIVGSMTYTFGPGSNQPPNSSGKPSPGSRTLTNSDENETDILRVWQYYRGATVKMDGRVFDVDFPTQGQPSFATTALNSGSPVPEEFIQSYSLTWRLVTIDALPEVQKRFTDAVRQARAQGLL